MIRYICSVLSELRMIIYNELRDNPNSIDFLDLLQDRINLMQSMVDRMENGLKLRQQFLKEKGLEEEYQQYKKQYAPKKYNLKHIINS